MDFNSKAHTKPRPPYANILVYNARDASWMQELSGAIFAYKDG
jgi:hypothetical protein